MLQNESDIKDYTHELNQSIMVAYLNGYQKTQVENKNTWLFDCQEVLRNYVLSRPGWELGKENKEEVIYKDKHSIDTHIIHNESPGLLMIRIAKEICNTELMNDLKVYKSQKVIDEIVQCVDSEDWTIPFTRRKIA